MMNIEEFTEPSFAYITCTSHTMNKLFLASAKSLISSMVMMKKIKQINTKKNRFRITENTLEELLIEYLQVFINLIRSGSVPIKINVHISGNVCDLNIITCCIDRYILYKIAENVKYSKLKIEKVNCKYVIYIIVEMLKKVSKK